MINFTLPFDPLFAEGLIDDQYDPPYAYGAYFF
jgi:hypothetical protein